MNQIPRIVIIDDEEDVGELIVSASEALGLSCIATSNVRDLFEALTPQTSLIFLDLMMPQLDGVEVLRLLSERPHKPHIVLMSGIGKRIIETAHRLAESLGLTVVADLEKPFRLTQIEQILKLQSTERHVTPQRSAVVVEISKEELQRALVRNEFLLHYQPQVRLSDRCVVGVEALVRWQHPERGLIYPDAFIPLIERHGLSGDLGWVVATLGLAEHGSFRKSIGRDISLSINISVDSLRDLSFPDRLLSLLHRYHGNPGNLVVEITESGLIRELSNTLDVLTRLRMKGVRLSIDDFGTGYSMMQQLRLVPANELKIDKSFVQNVNTSTSDRVMVLKTIEIAHELEMCSIAEGVETNDQLDFLIEHNCDIAQGYLFSKPVPADALRRWLAVGQ